MFLGVNEWTQYKNLKLLNTFIDVVKSFVLTEVHVLAKEQSVLKKVKGAHLSYSSSPIYDFNTTETSHISRKFE